MDALAKLSAATYALAEAKTLDDVKRIIDIAEAARTYARAAKLGLEAANHAAEVKLRAERKAGELLTTLAEQTEKGGDRRSETFQRYQADNIENITPYRAALADTATPIATAQRWQTVAQVPDEVFEEHVATVQQEQRELTSAGLLRLAGEIKQAAETIAPQWKEDELRRREFVEAGVTVHANMKTDLALIQWAKDNGLFERVDRATDWGNPFILPIDGDRQTVVENYQIYLDMKPSLLAKLHTLKGKVLGCWCYPEMCHAEVLEEYADDRAD